MAIDIVRTVGELRARVAAWRNDGLSVGLVPTMGALHEGHLSLVRLSLARTERTVVTLFINPRQFGEGEDLATYPRDEAADGALLAAQGAHLLFAPGIEEMYPPDHVTKVSVPGLGDDMEGAFRPEFFTGVATIVTKLLLQSLSDRAFFGEKDFQQLKVIERLVTDLDIPVAVEGGPTVRESDGLAMSSRNAYLDADRRAAAPALFKALCGMAARLAAGADVADEVVIAEGCLLDAGFSAIDYVEVRDARTLAPLEAVDGPARILAAAWLGSVRLIDNVEVPGPRTT